MKKTWPRPKQSTDGRPIRSRSLGSAAVGNSLERDNQPCHWMTRSVPQRSDAMLRLNQADATVEAYVKVRCRSASDQRGLGLASRTEGTDRDRG